MNFLKRAWLFFRGLADYGRPQSSDSGYFDPYVPLGSLKEIKEDFHQEPTTSVEQQPYEEVEQIKRGFVLFRTIVVIVAGTLMFRLVLLQITQGQENYLLAEGNRLDTEPILPARGLIYDRNGIPLVSNVPSFSLVLHPGELPRKDKERQVALTNLATLIDYSAKELGEIVRDNIATEAVVLKEGLSRTEALTLELKLNNVSGVELTTVPIRKYIAEPSLGHILGYVGKVTSDELEQRRDLLPISYIGKSGIEYVYDKILQGIPGVETLEVDSTGRTIRSTGIQPTQPGRSLLLSVDLTLQKQATKSLLESIRKNKAVSGSAVVMDVNTGDILAMVSVPFVDNNIFLPGGDKEKRAEALTDERAPLLNRAIAGQYPSGSTIKPVIAAAALQEGVISPTTLIDTSAGKIEIGQWTFPDWKVHGVTDVRKAIAESNNIFFYTIGGGHNNISGLGVNRLSEYLEKFGYGQKTNIDLTGEKSGLVPSPSWKEEYKGESWYIGDTYNLAIGQGDLLVTPLQLARSTAAIANSGKLIVPRVLKKYLAINNTKAEDVSVRVERDRFISGGVLDVVRQGMRQAVEFGSARSFNTLPVQVAAKTGTAQFDKAKEKTHSWFTAFAPYKKPEIAISVIVEGGGEGFSVAAPVAKNIFERYFGLSISPITPAKENE